MGGEKNTKRKDMADTALLSSVKKIIKKEELRIIVVLLLRETIALSLFSLAILLSLESLLPGTVSLRESMLLFIIGIAGTLLVERKLSSILKPESSSCKDASHQLPAQKKQTFLFWGFIIWSAFLLGNALFGFHPAIILILLIITTPLLAIFFDITFGKTGKISEMFPK